MPPSSEGRPLVSCIMPTCDRRQFVADAFRYFVRQDYLEKELIVVDDGAEAVEDLVPAGEEVRYFRVPKRSTVGAKRNLACERAAGSLIAHWDDDDWHAPGRLRLQVDLLRQRDADVCGLTTLLFLDIRDGRAWRFVYPEGQRGWLAGSSLMYKKAFWERHRFAEVNIGEDGQFVAVADPSRMAVVPDPTIHVGMIHGKNVCPKVTAGPFWQPYPSDELKRLLGDDWTVYRPDAPTPSGLEPPPAKGAAPSTIRNVFACLVHESPECVVDLVRNLRHLDPASTILLYDGSASSRLLAGIDALEQSGAVVHPAPKPMAWGRLHEFAVDCMRFALKERPFDTLTIVDSDQLATRPGYSARLASALEGQQGVGMLGNSPGVQRPNTVIPPARVAHTEVALWRPFLRQFPDGEDKFVHWSFWPSTVFTSEAARALVDLFDHDRTLEQLLRETRVWATEEVVLPTLVALLGFRVEANPCSYDFVRYRTPYTVAQLDAAMRRPDVYWAHPINRRYDDALRKSIRVRFRDYGQPGAGIPAVVATEAPEVHSPFVRTLPILARMRTIEGWLDDDEADLLIGATAHALVEHPEAHAVVEVGSYCGRGTVVLASVVKALRPAARVWSIDPHNGKLGTADRSITVGPSLEKLKSNIAAAGLADVVEIVRATAPQVPWKEPIALLLIDGLHDYASVARDFSHFEPWLANGAYVAFHDYASYFPGVMTFVDGLLAGGVYGRVHAAMSMMILQKSACQDDRPVRALPTPTPAD
jgi:Methyltransferase domain/Glycosyl transferase family 2